MALNDKMRTSRTPSSKRASENLLNRNFDDIANTSSQNSDKAKRSNTTIISLPLSSLVDNPANRNLSMDGIERLAKNIRSVGQNSPILVAAQKDGTYMILSGHRRKNAFQYNVDNEFGDEYKYIDAIVADATISEKGKDAIWFSDNFQSRYLTLRDTVNNIEFFLNEIETMSVEEKKSIISTLKNTEPSSTNKTRINKAGYIYLCLKDIGIPGWSETNIKRHIRLINALHPTIKEAYFDNHITLGMSLELINYKEDVQMQLFDVYNEKGKEAYMLEKAKIDKAKIVPKKSKMVEKLNSTKKNLLSVQTLVRKMSISQEELSHVESTSLEETYKILKDTIQLIDKIQKQ
ncbi:MAG: ParB/RepB/Spo0J family partition protein [Erysipelotrichaceae bacterium]